MSLDEEHLLENRKSEIENAGKSPEFKIDFKIKKRKKNKTNENDEEQTIRNDVR